MVRDNNFDFSINKSAKHTKRQFGKVEIYMHELVYTRTSIQISLVNLPLLLLIAVRRETAQTLVVARGGPGGLAVNRLFKGCTVLKRYPRIV